MREALNSRLGVVRQYLLPVVKALLVTPQGRYLLQLRDNLPTILMPDHWGLFGGAAESGESLEQAIRRELREELSYTPNHLEWFTEAKFILPAPSLETVHAIWCVIPITNEDVTGMVLGEGAGMALHSLSDALALEKISPWDLAAMMAYDRRRTLLG